VPDGPLFVRGDVTVTDEHGAVIRRDTRMALCRCGQSEHKPFCDNTHRRVGFRSGAPATASTSAAQRAGEGSND
jgi:CDGSH-type Zn-finger protein